PGGKRSAEKTPQTSRGAGTDRHRADQPARLWGRERADYTARYPELDVLRRLPVGTLLDGELVAFDAGGRPYLRLLLRRDGLADAWRIREARHWCSVRYVLFDLLYHSGRCLLHEPLVLPSAGFPLRQRAGNLGSFWPILSRASGEHTRTVSGALATCSARWCEWAGERFRPTCLVTTAYPAGRGVGRCRLYGGCLLA